MNNEKKTHVFEEPKIEICRFSSQDVLTTSAMPTMLTHGYAAERENCGLGGYFDTKNWYTDGYQG